VLRRVCSSSIQHASTRNWRHALKRKERNNLHRRQMLMRPTKASFYADSLKGDPTCQTPNPTAHCGDPTTRSYPKSTITRHALAARNATVSPSGTVFAVIDPHVFLFIRSIRALVMNVRTSAHQRACPPAQRNGSPVRRWWHQRYKSVSVASVLQKRSSR